MSDDGLTCIVRARTWSIQMKDSTGFTFNDLRVIGATPATPIRTEWTGWAAATRSSRRLPAHLRRCFRDEGNWDGTPTSKSPARPRRPEHPDRAQELSPASPHCARRLAAEILQLAQLYSAGLRYLHGGIARAARLLASSASGAKRRQGDHSNFTLRISSSITGTRWCKWSWIRIRASRPAWLHLRNIWGSTSRRWPIRQ